MIMLARKEIISRECIKYLEGFNVDGREEGAEKEKGASTATHVSLSVKYRISGAQ